MPDEQNKKPDPSDDSSVEMDIIKGVLGSEGEESKPSDQVFSEDLFGEPAAQPPAPQPPKAEPKAPASPRVVESIDELAEGEQTRPGKEAAPAPQAPAAAPPKAAPAKPAPPKPAPAAPAPKKPAPQAKPSEGIKVVTDDDLREIFDASQPGIQPGAKAPEPAPKTAKKPAPEPSPAAEESLISSRPGIPPPPPAPDPTSQFIAGAPAPPPRKAQPAMEQEEAGGLLGEEESPEEMVEQFEDRAEVGEMTFVPTAKKGDALQKTAELMQALEPAGDDFMNTDELKKLFNNVNILIEWARGTSERLERLEEMLEELIGAKGKD